MQDRSFERKADTAWTDGYTPFFKSAFVDSFMTRGKYSMLDCNGLLT